MTDKDGVTLDVEQAQQMAAMQEAQQQPPPHAAVNCAWVCCLVMVGWLPLWLYLDFSNDNCDGRVEIFFICLFAIIGGVGTLSCIRGHLVRIDFDAGSPQYPITEKVRAPRRIPGGTSAHGLGEHCPSSGTFDHCCLGLPRIFRVSHVGRHVGCVHRRIAHSPVFSEATVASQVSATWQSTKMDAKCSVHTSKSSGSRSSSCSVVCAAWDASVRQWRQGGLPRRPEHQRRTRATGEGRGGARAERGARARGEEGARARALGHHLA